MKNNKKIIFGLISFLICSFISVGKVSAFYFDDEESPDNQFRTRSLDIELTSTDFVHDTLNYLLPNTPMKKTLVVENVGNTETVYSIETGNLSGDLNVCKAIDLELLFRAPGDPDWTPMTPDSGSKLDKYILNFLGTDLNMHFEVGELAHEYKIVATLPNDSDSVLSLQDCSFDLIVKAWMPEFSYGVAYWDIETDVNKLETGDWGMEMGYETTETLDDTDDGDPKLGFCPVVTYAYDSSHDDKALQEIKWDYLADSQTYKITEFKNISGIWVSTGVMSLDTSTSGLSIDTTDEVVTYSRYVSEGEYAYFIESFDGDGNLIGSTYPELDKFTCTYEFIKRDSGDIVINEVMWGGSHEHERDEWVELRNTTDKEIDLTDWVLEGAGPAHHGITLSGKVPAKGYYLISYFPTDYLDPGNNYKAAVDDAIDEDEFHRAAPDGMHLREQGEKLTLKDPAGNVIDETPDVPNGPDGDWAAGEVGQYGAGNSDTLWKSMQRIELEGVSPGDGNNKDNWYTCNHDECNDSKYWDDGGDAGRDFGTPKNRNLLNEEQKDEAAILEVPMLSVLTIETFESSLPVEPEGSDETKPPMCIPDEETTCPADLEDPVEEPAVKEDETDTEGTIIEEEPDDEGTKETDPSTDESAPQESTEDTSAPEEEI